MIEHIYNEQCSECFGTGRIELLSAMPLASYDNIKAQRCITCRGTGSVYRHLTGKHTYKTPALPSRAAV